MVLLQYSLIHMIMVIKSSKPRTSLVVKWLRLCPFKVGDVGSIPDEGSHVLHSTAKKKSNKPNASFLSRLPMPPFFPHCLSVIISNDINFSIVLAVISKLMFFGIFFSSTNKQLFSYMSARLSRFLSGYGTFWLNHSSINWMRFCSHGSINLIYGWKSYKTKYSFEFCFQDLSLPESVSFPHGS